MTTGMSLALSIVGFLLVGAFIIGIAMLFRYREGAKSSSATGLPQLRTRANVLLV